MKISVLPFQPHCLAFGGFEIQMLAAIEAAQMAGINISKLDVWNRHEDFDILHLWGLDSANLQAVIWAKKARKRIVLSALLPYSTPKTIARNMIGQLFGYKRDQNKILALVDHLIVVNDAQASAAKSMLGFPKDRISVIPNIVGDIYFRRDKDDAGVEDYGIENYLICTANVCSRKNQVLLAKAASEENIPLLIVGQKQAGEDKYIDALRELINKNNKIRWVTGLPAYSSKLYEAYRNSAGFALVSTNETQPISALEAAAMGKPLLLSNSAWSRQCFYSGACLVNQNSINSIRQGMRLLVQQPDRYIARSNEIESCRQVNIAKAYARAYNITMGRGC